jgi:solute carrier family 35 protein
MVIGALIASGDDLTFNWFGYLFLTINNLFTTAQGLVIKQKLVNKVKEIYCILLNNDLILYRILIKMVFYFIIHLLFLDLLFY